MSNIKDLRESASNTINIVDLVSVLTHGNKPKYTETLLRILKNKFATEESKEIQIHETKKLFPFLNVNDLKKLSSLELVAFNGLFTSFFTQKELDNFFIFCTYNERGLVEDNDVSKYRNFDVIIEKVKTIGDKQLEKEMEMQVDKLYDNDGWLLIRPLTFESSKKYGAHTKWCTTSAGSESTFDSYINKGILFYIINRLTDQKVACFKALTGSNPEFSFWDAKDNKIDSMASGVPYDILKLINIEINNPHAKTNKVLGQKVKSIKPSLLKNYY